MFNYIWQTSPKYWRYLSIYFFVVVILEAINAYNLDLERFSQTVTYNDLALHATWSYLILFITMHIGFRGGYKLLSESTLSNFKIGSFLILITLVLTILRAVLDQLRL